MKKIILLILSTLLLYSCGVNRVYTPANYGSIKKYIAKPIYSDTVVKANYISLNITSGKHPHQENKTNNIKGAGTYYTSKKIDADSKIMAAIYYHKSISSKKSNLYYGIGFNYGNYNFNPSLNDIIKENEFQNFYIINPKIGLSFKKTSSKFDYHFIGLELNYNYEGGSYLDKLSKIPSSSSIKVVNEKSMFSYNLFTELLFKMNTDNTFGLGLFAGGIIGLNEAKYDINYNDGKGFGGLTISYRFKNTTFSLVSESAARKIQSINYSISYEF